MRAPGTPVTLLLTPAFPQSETSVTHPYPLHTQLEVQCYCCRSQQSFIFTSPSDQVVCAHCRNHQGDAKVERRGEDHITLWSSIYDAKVAEFDALTVDAAAAAAANVATISSLTVEVAELKALVAGQFDRTEAGGVRDALQDDLVKRAERRGELVARRLDVAMAALWQLDQLHHEDPSNPAKCSCGKPITSCPESRALEPIRQALAEWEKRNVELLGSGQRHALPPQHLRLRK